MDERKWTFKKVIKKVCLYSIYIFLVILLYGAWVYLQTQRIEDPKKCFTTKMYGVKLCPGTASYVSYHQVPTLFFRALIMSEDASFYMHSGFDWYEIKESFWQNIHEWRFVRGGSTLTQQLAKNLYLSKEKSLDRKFKEIFISKQIEKYLSKTQILEKYVNVVEFSENIYGIQPAAQYFFNKRPKELNVLESTYLVSLLPNPKTYSLSFKKRKLSKTNIRRMKTILKRLYRTKRITDHLFVYCETLIEQEPWPFPYFSENGFSEDIKTTIEDELFLELDQAETHSNSFDSNNNSDSNSGPSSNEEINQEFNDAEGEEFPTQDGDATLDEASKLTNQNEESEKINEPTLQEDDTEIELKNDVDDEKIKDKGKTEHF